MNDREFVCSRTILPYFFRTGLIIKGGGGGGICWKGLSTL